MFIIYSIKTKSFLIDRHENELNPLTGSKGVEFEVTQSYMEWLLPIMPISKKHVQAYAIGSDQAIPESVWSDSMKQKALQCKQQAKGTWKLFLLPIVLLLICIAGFIFSRMDMASTQDSKAKQTELRQDPKVNDLVLIKVWPQNYGTIDNVYGAVFKIVKVEGDLLYIRRSKEHRSVKQVYKLQGLKKILGKFGKSDSDFESDVEVYTIESYTNLKGSTLQSPKDKPKKDHLLEILYIGRDK